MAENKNPLCPYCMAPVESINSASAMQKEVLYYWCAKCIEIFYFDEVIKSAPQQKEEPHDGTTNS